MIKKLLPLIVVHFTKFEKFIYYFLILNIFFNIFIHVYKQIYNDTKTISEKCINVFSDNYCLAAETSSPLHAQSERGSPLFTDISSFYHITRIQAPWRFPRNAIRGRRLLNFSTFRFVLFSGEFHVASWRARFTLSAPPAIIEFQRPI